VRFAEPQKENTACVLYCVYQKLSSPNLSKKGRYNKKTKKCWGSKLALPCFCPPDPLWQKSPWRRHSLVSCVYATYVGWKRPSQHLNPTSVKIYTGYAQLASKSIKEKNYHGRIAHDRNRWMETSCTLVQVKNHNFFASRFWDKMVVCVAEDWMLSSSHTNQESGTHSSMVPWKSWYR